MFGSVLGMITAPRLQDGQLLQTTKLNALLTHWLAGEMDCAIASWVYTDNIINQTFNLLLRLTWNRTVNEIMIKYNKFTTFLNKYNNVYTTGIFLMFCL